MPSFSDLFRGPATVGFLLMIRCLFPDAVTVVVLEGADLRHTTPGIVFIFLSIFLVFRGI